LSGGRDDDLGAGRRARCPQRRWVLICTLGDPVLAKKPDGYVSVMLLPAASAPPAVVVKENVAAAAVLAATRSAEAIQTDRGRHLPRQSLQTQPSGSSRVHTRRNGDAVLHLWRAPMVKPVTVTVTAALASIAAPAVVTTIWVQVGVRTEPVAPLPLICTLGDPVLAKKPDGYVSVMLLPAASAPPAVVVKENVAAAESWPATRSAEAIQT
jgi:hypothetical protein